MRLSSRSQPALKSQEAQPVSLVTPTPAPAKRRLLEKAASATHSPMRLLTGRIGAQELRRRMWHFFPGVLAFAIQMIPHRDPVRYPVMLLIVALGIVLPAYVAIRSHRYFRRHPEEDFAPPILGYALPLAVLCLLFPGHLELPLAVATIIAFGDGSATLVGLLTRGKRLPWNPRKTWLGAGAFLVFGTLLATTIYLREATPAVAPATAFLCVAPVVFVCAVMETLPLRWNDNLTVGTTAGLLLIVTQTLVVGWA